MTEHEDLVGVDLCQAAAQFQSFGGIVHHFGVVVVRTTDFVDLGAIDVGAFVVAQGGYAAARQGMCHLAEGTVGADSLVAIVGATAVYHHYQGETFASLLRLGQT